MRRFLSNCCEAGIQWGTDFNHESPHDGIMQLQEVKSSKLLNASPHIMQLCQIQRPYMYHIEQREGAASPAQLSLHLKYCGHLLGSALEEYLCDIGSCNTSRRSTPLLTGALHIQATCMQCHQLQSAYLPPGCVNWGAQSLMLPCGPVHERISRGQLQLLKDYPSPSSSCDMKERFQMRQACTNLCTQDQINGRGRQSQQPPACSCNTQR